MKNDITVILRLPGLLSIALGDKENCENNLGCGVRKMAKKRRLPNRIIV